MSEDEEALELARTQVTYCERMHDGECGRACVFARALLRQRDKVIEETKALAIRLDKYYSEWAPRCRNGTEYGEGDWRWLAQHLRDIARSYVEPVMSADLQEKKEAAIRSLQSSGRGKG